MENTAKHFALQLGALISLYVSLTTLVILLFSIINIYIPDAAAGSYEMESSMSSARFAIATLIVFFPVYLWLTRVVNKMRRNGDGSYLSLTKWLIYLSLLVSGLVLLGSGVATVFTFLNGELTLRFILKALSLFIIVGSAFTYYLLDAKYYWQKNEKQSLQYGAVASLIVLVIVVVGFTQIQMPSEVREMRLDERQISDLQQIQWKLTERLQVGEALPDSLEAAFDGMPVPEAPEGRAAYEYRKTEAGFELCADFAEASQMPSVTYPYYDEKSLIRNPDAWDHGAGKHCFERIVGTVEPVTTIVE